MSQHIVHYKGYTIHYHNGVYKVAELFQSFLSMTEAMKRVDKKVGVETFVNLKKLNETNQTAIKQD